MIYVDCTRTGRSSHSSGLLRVTRRLCAEWGTNATPVRFAEGRWKTEQGPVAFAPEDWLFTAELFSREERPGWFEGGNLPVRQAALFHDAIPLKWPAITWPQSVARHPEYMKLLAGFDRVFAVSRASRDELEHYWRWLGVKVSAPVQALPLGADLAGVPRVEQWAGKTEPLFLSVGIVEPRKNQWFLLEVAESLWAEGLKFSLHLVGRVNPHFGRPVVERIKSLRRQGRALFHHEGLEDEALRSLYARARIHFFPTLAEGCGLPLLESLWLGTPCVCSDLPVLRENADEGGCLALPVGDAERWRETWRRAVVEPSWVDQWGGAACTRALPTWREAADRVRRELTGA